MTLRDEYAHLAKPSQPYANNHLDSTTRSLDQIFKTEISSQAVSSGQKFLSVFWKIGRASHTPTSTPEHCLKK
jgi:hypothetical protein